MNGQYFTKNVNFLTSSNRNDLGFIMTSCYKSCMRKNENQFRQYHNVKDEKRGSECTLTLNHEGN